MLLTHIWFRSVWSQLNKSSGLLILFYLPYKDTELKKKIQNFRCEKESLKVTNLKQIKMNLNIIVF